jgi:hypothetical protein
MRIEFVHPRARHGGSYVRSALAPRLVDLQARVATATIEQPAEQIQSVLSATVASAHPGGLLVFIVLLQEFLGLVPQFVVHDPEIVTLAPNMLVSGLVFLPDAAGLGIFSLRERFPLGTWDYGGCGEWRSVAKGSALD